MVRVPQPYVYDGDMPEVLVTVKRRTKKKLHELRLLKYEDGLCLQVEDPEGGGEIWFQDTGDLREALLAVANALKGE